MYSKDRRDAFDATLSCLQDMPLFNECQKTLIIDGKLDIHIPGWYMVQVPRVGDKFCWGRMWDAGVGTARYPKVVYLDSDRLLPPSFLEKAAEAIEDDMFVFTSQHFLMLKPIEDYKALLLRLGHDDNVLLEENFVSNLKFDIRRMMPHHAPGKNVMSGSTGFTRKTYVRLGGVDHWYCGHGAFADTDFHMQAFTKGCKFFDLGLPELHYPHLRKEGDNVVGELEYKLMGLNNFIHYCCKWNAPLSAAEALANRIGVPNAAQYVRNLAKSD